MTYKDFKERYVYWGLLLSFAASFIATPFYGSASQPLNVFLLTSTAFAIMASSHSKRGIFFSAGLGMITLLSIVGYAFHIHEMAEIMFYIFAATFYLYIVESLLADIFRTRSVTTNTLLSAVSVYFAFAVIWAMIYGMILYCNTAAFEIGPSNESTHSIHTLMYFSVVTLTTLGYGDITPVSDAAKAFAAMQALVGQVYLTVLVARLVGLHIAERPLHNSHKEQ